MPRKKKTLIANFKNLVQDVGIIDIAIRFDIKTGKYDYIIQENGLDINLPIFYFNGIIETFKDQIAINSVLNTAQTMIDKNE